MGKNPRAPRTGKSLTSYCTDTMKWKKDYKDRFVLDILVDAKKLCVKYADWKIVTDALLQVSKGDPSLAVEAFMKANGITKDLDIWQGEQGTLKSVIIGAYDNAINYVADSI